MQRNVILVYIFFTLSLFNCINSQQLGPSVYLGCYLDHENRAMKGPVVEEKQKMTLEFCRNFCLTRSQNSFFGTQHMFQCFCGEQYDRLGSLAESRCYRKCNGNTSQICGGDWALSVYTVCPVGYYGRNCTDRCGHCRNTTAGCGRDGRCLKGGCEVGWVGVNCSTDADECKENDPCSRKIYDSECVNTPGSFNCVCGAGLQLSADGKKCEDIHECLGDHGCETNSSKGYCNNTYRSFECKCSEGYEMMNGSNMCQDNNECLVDNGGCSHQCHNSEGSYECSCPHGYQLNGKLCSDIDECAEKALVEICGEASLNCTNTAGSYLCNCREGTYARPDFKFCLESLGLSAVLLTILLPISLTCIVLVILVLLFLRRKERILTRVENMDSSAYHSDQEVRYSELKSSLMKDVATH